MNLMDYKNKKVHFIAVGGSSMSGLAMMLHNLGFDKLSGSDQAEGKALPALRDAGIKISVGHDEKNVQGAELVIYSAAVNEKNCEFAYAKQHGIPMLRRDELLGELSKAYKNCIAVSGTHGKTTTTGMISEIFQVAGKDATIHIGGVLPMIHSNVRLGHGDAFITEACEYVDSFLTLHPKFAIVLNIDADHLDYFKDIDHIYASFMRFVQPVPEDGCVIGCGDDKRTAKLLKECGKHTVSYGFEDTNDYYARNIEFSPQGYPSYDFCKDGKCLFRVELSIVGKLNVLNSMAAIICCMKNGISESAIKEGLHAFCGVMRRFEDRGTCNGARLIHDYAHHPQEVAATILAAQPIEKNRLWVVYQPALFSRTKAQFDRLVKCFKGADKVIVIDIYGSREPFDPTIHSKMLVDKIVEQEKQDCIYIPTMQEAAEYLKQHLEPGDLCLNLGSGSIDKLDTFITGGN